MDAVRIIYVFVTAVLTLSTGFLIGYAIRAPVAPHTSISTSVRWSAHSRFNPRLHHEVVVAEQLYKATLLLGGQGIDTYPTNNSWRYEYPTEVTQLAKSWVEKASTIHTCRLDPSLLEALGKLPRKNYMVVANFRNSESIMAHWVQQIVTLTALLPGNISLSVYESGSGDNTKLALSQLTEVLGKIDIPTSIVYDGKISRSKDEARISFLAKVRNAALEPLYKSKGKGSLPKPDYVIFVNDVFYCANDVLRLALHRADIACGIDINPGNVEEGDTSLYLYDIWVARDIEGQKAESVYPFTRHAPSGERIKAGLPTPVHCCWNGLVVFNAKPFTEGLRIRSHMEGECAASECSLFCDDMHRLGYRNVLLDPAVRVTYFQKTFEVMHKDDAKPGYIPWSHVAGSMAHALHTQHFQRVNQSECCPLPPGREHLDWGNSGCHMDDFMTPNFTKVFLESDRSKAASYRAADDQPNKVLPVEQLQQEQPQQEEQQQQQEGSIPQTQGSAGGLAFLAELLKKAKSGTKLSELLGTNQGQGR